MQDARVALVTGAASGLGFAIAVRLAERGHLVVAIDRDTKMKMAFKDVDGSVDIVIADLSNANLTQTLCQLVVARHGRLDILVNNAGISPKVFGKRPETELMTLEAWDEVISINLTAPSLLCRDAIPHMRERKWGRIINMSSRAGRTYVKTAGAHYAATKAGLIGLTRNFAGELARYGITANCLAPGRISTALSEQGSDEMLAARKREIPIGRAGEAWEVGAAAAFLASDEAAFITGTVLDVNGGSFMT